METSRCYPVRKILSVLGHLSPDLLAAIFLLCAIYFPSLLNQSLKKNKTQKKKKLYYLSPEKEEGISQNPQ